jgi:hypothetical protein
MQMKSLPTILVGSAATVLMLNGLAFAQQQPDQQKQHQQDQGQQLSNKEVRQYLSTVERDINQIVQSRNPSRWRQWTQNNIADNAVFSRTNVIGTEGKSTVIGAVTITKPELLRLQGTGLSSMSEKLGSVEDFHLELRVVNIRPVGDGAAMVKSRISERATLMPTPGEAAGHASQQREFTTGQARSSQPSEEFEDEQAGGRRPSRSQQSGLQLESQATCTHLIERNPDSGHLQIGMGICSAETTAEF